jgi:CheY-like chemotaxis protein
MLNVLVVDDDPNLLRVMERMLRTKSYRVMTASSGLAAMEQAANEVPDILITDYNLQGTINGLDICRMFTQDAKLNAARRIIISGQIGNLSGEGTLFDIFLAKPFTAQEFFQTIEKVLPHTPTENCWITGC